MAASAEEHFLDFSKDNFKVSFISGNLTAAITYAWPRVIFQHSTDLFSATFEVGMPTIYLFNDTNDDGLFSRSEATYTAYLGSLYDVTWNVSEVGFYNDTAGGEVALFTMSAPLSLYLNSTDVEPTIRDWANATFWFRICERKMTYTNSYGSYDVQGKTELQFNYSLHIRQKMNFTGLALEHLLKGGGSANMFLLREASSRPGGHLTPVYSREDETVNGPDFTHKFVQTSSPCQEIAFAKDDNTIQAFYYYSSEPLGNVSGSVRPVGMNSSFYTTGSGMILDVAYSVDNETSMLSHEGFIGIDEAGFKLKVRDWFENNIAAILAVTGGLMAVVATAVLVTKLRLRNRGARGGQDTPEPKK
jgi:hypothetical protein